MNCRVYGAVLLLLLITSPAKPVDIYDRFVDSSLVAASHRSARSLRRSRSDTHSRSLEGEGDEELDCGESESGVSLLDTVILDQASQIKLFVFVTNVQTVVSLMF